MDKLSEIKPHFDALKSPVASLAFRLGVMEAKGAQNQNRAIEIMRDKYRQAKSSIWEPIPPDEERIFAETQHAITKEDCKRIMKETRDKGAWSLRG